MKDYYKDDLGMQIARANRLGDIFFLEKVFLIEKQADVSETTTSGRWNRLHRSLNVPDKTPAEVIKFYVDNGVEVNGQDGSGATPLHYAVRSNNTPAVKILLEAGADPNISDCEGVTPFDNSFAKERLDFVMIEELLRYGANPNKTPSGRTRMAALKFALENLVATEEKRKDMEQARVLLERYGGHD